MRRGSKGGSSCLPLGPVVSREPHSLLAAPAWPGAPGEAKPGGCCVSRKRNQNRLGHSSLGRSPSKAAPWGPGHNQFTRGVLALHQGVEIHSGILQLRMVLRAQLCCIPLAVLWGLPRVNGAKLSVCRGIPGVLQSCPTSFWGERRSLRACCPPSIPHLGLSCTWEGCGFTWAAVLVQGQDSGAVARDSRCFSCSKGTVHLPGLRPQWGGGWQHKTVRIKAGPAF